MKPTCLQASCDTDSINRRTAQITQHRHEASIVKKEQAERMVQRSRIDLQAGVIGDNVAVPIPAVDTGRGDPRNILGVVVNKTDNDQYKIAVKGGLLNGHYSRNQFDLCPQRLLVSANDSDVGGSDLSLGVFVIFLLDVLFAHI